MIALHHLLKKISRFYFSRNFNLKQASHNQLFSPQNRDYLLYVHIPFCEELCPYCSFFRVPFQEDLLIRYYKALKKEIFWLKKQGFRFTALYVGGGTPTIDMTELISLLDLVQDIWPIKEISLETHPNHLEKEKIQLLVNHGLKRLSVGVQSFNNQLLKAMNRYKKYGSSEEIQKRIKNIKDIVPTLNIDLIFGLEKQSLAMLQEDLSVFKELKANQITYYPLMGAENQKQSLSLSQERDFYNTIYRNLNQNFQARSPWCFSQNSTMVDEYIIDHEEYVGAGAGALSYLDGSLFAHSFNIDVYIDKINKGEFQKPMEKSFSRANQIRYSFFSQLFGRAIDWTGLKKRYGQATALTLWKELLFFRGLGYLKKKGGRFFLKARGYFSVMLIMKEFFHGVNIFRKMATDLYAKASSDIKTKA